MGTHQIVQRALSVDAPPVENGAQSPAVEPEMDVEDMAKKVQREIDMEELVAKVQRQLRRRLVVESERRGWVQWP